MRYHEPTFRTQMVIFHTIILGIFVSILFTLLH
jgi:hypothetical protein